MPGRVFKTNLAVAINAPVLPAETMQSASPLATASMAWRMDNHWKKLRSENPLLKRLPSEYMRSNVWFTTQPIEEPEPREHMVDAMHWLGWDRFLFATDYPHWDFDDPATCLPVKMDEAQRRQFFIGNARAVYGLG